MHNLLKRNDFGGIDRICHHGRDMNAEWGCAGCEYRTRCNAEIFERLAQFEEIGIEPGQMKAVADDFRHIVVEVCPHCDAENEMVWDVSEKGYKSFCPSCGKTMMLCDECIHAEDRLNENANHCDWREDENGNEHCFRCR